MNLRLNSEKSRLRDKAADLSERYEDLQDNGQRLRSRIEIVLQKLQRQVNKIQQSIQGETIWSGNRLVFEEFHRLVGLYCKCNYLLPMQHSA